MDMGSRDGKRRGGIVEKVRWDRVILRLELGSVR